MLEIRNPVTERKNGFDGLIGRLSPAEENESMSFNTDKFLKLTQ